MYRVEGFVFETEEQARTARKEAEGIRYIKNQTNMNNPETVLQLYNRLIVKEVFVTPVGFAFLGTLRDYLNTIPYIRHEDIMPIPVFHPDTAMGVEADADNRNSPQVDREYRKRKERAEREYRKNHKEVIRRNRRNEKERDRQARQEEFAVKYAGKNYRRQFLVSTFFAVVFGVALVGVFAIMAFSTDNVTIINYENAIIDKYEAWDEELTEREAAVKEREEALGISQY